MDDASKTSKDLIAEIAERVRAEKQLADQPHLNQILMDAMPCVALLIRPHSREIIASNKAAAEVGAVPGKTCYQTWAQSDSPLYHVNQSTSKIPPHPESTPNQIPLHHSLFDIQNSQFPPLSAFAPLPNFFRPNS